jgi:hypothetical protein
MGGAARPAIRVAWLRLLAALVLLAAGVVFGGSVPALAETPTHAHHGHAAAGHAVDGHRGEDDRSASGHARHGDSAAHAPAHGGCDECADCADHGGCLFELHEGARSLAAMRPSAPHRLRLTETDAHGRALDPALRPPRPS